MVPRFIRSVMSRTHSPGRIPGAIPIIVTMNGLRSWWQGKIHQMRDGCLTFSTACGSHGGLSGVSNGTSFLVPNKERSEHRLTDSAKASSSANLDFFWLLCCRRPDCVFLGEARVVRAAEPAPKLPEPPGRRWLKLSE